MDNLLLKNYQRSHSEIKNKFLNSIHEGNLVSINVCMWGFFVINWKLIGMKLLAFFHFISLSIKFFCFVFVKKTFESILLSLIQKSKIKINPIYLIQSIYHLWCVLNTDTIGFSVTENLSFISQDHQYTDVGPAWTFCSLSKRNISSHQTSHTLLAPDFN